MIVKAFAVARSAALYLPSRPRGASFRWQAIAAIAARHRNLAFPLTLAGSALAGAVTTSAVLDWQDTSWQGSNPASPALQSVRNETVVYPQTRFALASAEQGDSGHPNTVQVEAADELDDGDVRSNFPREVQTIRFTNPDASAEISAVAPETGGPVRRALIKIGRFVAFAPKENAKENAKESVGADAGKSAAPAGKRAGSGMEEVDAYLWEVYQRIPVKKDGTGDFTWKDPAAAKHMGIGMRDYVIGGMDPEFREQLYAAGRAMDAAGLQWSMLSAFRDDYRQGLASGFKASVGNSLHGGSRRTGGYGHGRAIDITGPEGKESDVWKWIDAHGAKYGLHRPLPGADPAHIQQRGDSHKIAVAMRESRTRVAASAEKPSAEKKARKTAVAAAR
jgi:hypothetical protein